jgi:hypothetical protein
MHSISRFFLPAVLLFALSFIVPMIFRLFSRGPRDRARVVVEYAQKKGYALLNPSLAQALDASRLDMLKDPALRNSIHASADITDIEELANGSGDWLAFTCELGSKEVTIFNLNVSFGTVNTRSPGVSYKVAKIRAGGLPQFSLGRNSALHTMENVVDRLTADTKPTVDLDAHIFPEFSAHFWIRGSDPAAVVEFLSAAKIRFLEATRLEGVLAANDRYLVYFENGILLKDEDFDTFIATVEQLVANML